MVKIVSLARYGKAKCWSMSHRILMLIHTLSLPGLQLEAKLFIFPEMQKPGFCVLFTLIKKIAKDEIFEAPLVFPSYGQSDCANKYRRMCDYD